MQNYYAMIMAGGGGTRLWPMSRSSTPKQLLPLVDGHSMFQVSVERLTPVFPPENIYIVTGEKYVEAMQAEVPQVPAQNFIVEPYGKDSGPAAALGITVIQQRDPDATVAILTADHHIAYEQTFRSVLAAAYELAQQGKIITLGISPSYPATGFGYIQRGDLFAEVNDFKTYTSLGFTEKPDARRAMGFIHSGTYSWNSGMFIWKAEKAMSELQRQQRDMHDNLRELAAHVDQPTFAAQLHTIWERIERISLDYAVMENAEDMLVIPVDIGWSDVGSWDALYDIIDLDEAGNGFRGTSPDNMVIDTKNTLVYSDKLTVTIGVEDIVVVETDDVLMICHKTRTQEVKEVVKRLKATNLENYL